jgi:hypothetical protein
VNPVPCKRGLINLFSKSWFTIEVWYKEICLTIYNLIININNTKTTETKNCNQRLNKPSDTELLYLIRYLKEIFSPNTPSGEPLVQALLFSAFKTNNAIFCHFGKLEYGATTKYGMTIYPGRMPLRSSSSRCENVELCYCSDKITSLHGRPSVFAGAREK